MFGMGILRDSLTVPCLEWAIYSDAMFGMGILRDSFTRAKFGTRYKNSERFLYLCQVWHDKFDTGYNLQLRYAKLFSI